MYHYFTENINFNYVAYRTFDPINNNYVSYFEFFRCEITVIQLSGWRPAQIDQDIWSSSVLA